MKKTILPLLLVCCLLLGACGTDSLRKQYDSFTEDLLQKENLSFKTKLIAAYPNRTAEFTLNYKLEGDQQRVTVLAPGRISGVTAHTNRDSTTLEYDGLILDTGDLDQQGLTPLSALPLLVEALRSGHADAFWTEDSKTVVQILYDDHTTVQVWFEEDMIPCHGKLISDGIVTVECEIENWS